MSRQNPMARTYEAGDMCQDKNKERRVMRVVGPHILKKIEVLRTQHIKLIE
jgi:hypothetical protein